MQTSFAAQRADSVVRPRRDQQSAAFLSFLEMNRLCQEHRLLTDMTEFGIMRQSTTVERRNCLYRIVLGQVAQCEFRDVRRIADGKQELKQRRTGHAKNGRTGDINDCL